MRYPPPFLDRLRQQFRLSEVIGQRIQLKRRGRESMGLCPFHGEKTPSFTVNDEKGFYHCFGCGVHGDVIGFIKEYDKLSYREAVESLARQAGISLPQVSPQQQRQMEKGDLLYNVMEAAASWFALQLRNSSGMQAQDYIARRALAPETVSEFRLGFAPGKRTALKDALMQKGMAESLLLEAGLLAAPEDGGPSFDKFRGRLMFPINDASGRVIAFGGRLIDPEAKGPKYLNSPDTPLFKKSYNLYHFDVARRTAKGALIVAEGYMDVIALAQAGMPHAVAPLGTAITPEQLRMLWQVADEPVLCLDGDAAGQRAMDRAMELALPLLQPGKSLRFARLPAGEDPDSLTRKYGAEGMERVLSQALPLVEVLWQKHFADRPQATPEQQAGAEEALRRIVDTIQQASVREHYRQAVKERIWEDRQQKRAAKRQPGQAAAPSVGSAQLRGSSVALLSPVQGRLHAREETQRSLLSLVCYYPGLLEDGLEELLVHCHFSEAWMEELRDGILGAYGEIEGRAELQQRLNGSAKASWDRFHAEMTRKKPLPKALLALSEAEGMLQAADLAKRLQERLEILNLEEECDEAQAIAGRSSDARDWERLEMLNRRLQELQHSPSFFPEESA